MQRSLVFFKDYFLSADTDAPQPCDEALVESKIF